MSWRERAACRGMDISLFFIAPSGKNDADAAKKVCGTCPVVDPCLDIVLYDSYDHAGIFGGTTPRDRRRIRAERHIVPSRERDFVFDHGTANGYRHHRCRCVACCDAHQTMKEIEKERQPRSAC